MFIYLENGDLMEIYMHDTICNFFRGISASLLFSGMPSETSRPFYSLLTLRQLNKNLPGAHRAPPIGITASFNQEQRHGGGCCLLEQGTSNVWTHDIISLNKSLEQFRFKKKKEKKMKRQEEAA